jgi:hypothetical protein
LINTLEAGLTSIYSDAILERNLYQETLATATQVVLRAVLIGAGLMSLEYGAQPAIRSSAETSNAYRLFMCVSVPLRRLHGIAAVSYVRRDAPLSHGPSTSEERSAPGQTRSASARAASATIAPATAPRYDRHGHQDRASRVRPDR